MLETKTKRFGIVHNFLLLEIENRFQFCPESTLLGQIERICFDKTNTIVFCSISIRYWNVCSFSFLTYSNYQLLMDQLRTIWLTNEDVPYFSVWVFPPPLSSDEEVLNPSTQFCHTSTVNTFNVNLTLIFINRCSLTDLTVVLRTRIHQLTINAYIFTL